MLDATSHSLPTGRIFDDISQTIGNTPLIRLSRHSKKYNLASPLLAKTEYFNPAGSIKDRPALAMFRALMASPEFSSKTQIIEASSGNNGVACAWLGALYDIPVTIVIPEHMSVERQMLIRHYGGQVVTTAKELGTKGAIDKAKRLIQQTPNAVGLDQFANKANPLAHALTTAEEIWRDTGGAIDVLVCGVGTGGTLTGVARALREKRPNLQVVAVEPARCPVLSEGRSGVHNIQGLSSGHIPEILDTSLIDQVIAVEEEDALVAAKEVARNEGLAVGISSGAALHAATALAKGEFRGKSIVVILADGAERYYSTSLFC